MIFLPRGHVLQRVPIEAECPLCHSINAYLLYSVTSQQVAQHIYGNKKTPELTWFKGHVEELWRGKSCNFVQCDHCSLSYAHPFTPGDSTFYELIYQSGTGYAQWKWEFQITHAALQLFLQEQSGTTRLLEIGAGNGAFVKKITPGLIPKSQVMCTEYSTYGRNEIAKYGVQCLPLEIQTLNEAEHGKFDVVCMFEVLEHLGRLDTVFESLSRIMKDGAHLFIGVPNSFSRIFYDRLGFVEDVPPTHISRWNKQCFEFLAKNYGWRLIEHAVEPQSCVSKIKKYAFFHYQQSFFSSYLETLPPGFSRKLLKTLAMIVQLPIALPSILPLMSSKMGTVQWAHLQKN